MKTTGDESKPKKRRDTKVSIHFKYYVQRIK